MNDNDYLKESQRLGLAADLAAAEVQLAEAEASLLAEVEANLASVQEIENAQPEPLPEKKEPFRHTTPRIRRNEQCPCGSGQKFKRCHQRAQTEAVKMVGDALRQADQVLSEANVETALAQTHAA